MRLYIKQQVFSWRDRFFICDDTGRELFYAEGEIFSWGKRLHIYDMNDYEVAYIGEKLAFFQPRFSIEIGGNVICEIVKEFTLFAQSYRLEGLPLRLEGDVFAHEYELLDDVECIMALSKKWFTWGDSYELDIFQPGSELLCLCVALAVDCALARQRN